MIPFSTYGRRGGEATLPGWEHPFPPILADGELPIDRLRSVPATLDWTGMQQRHVECSDTGRGEILYNEQNAKYLFWPEEYAFKELFARPCEKSSRTSPSSEVMSK